MSKALAPSPRTDAAPLIAAGMRVASNHASHGNNRGNALEITQRTAATLLLGISAQAGVSPAVAGAANVSRDVLSAATPAAPANAPVVAAVQEFKAVRPAVHGAGARGATTSFDPK